MHQCYDIKILKDGTQVTPSGLLPGDKVVLWVKGTGAPTKARFRVNGDELVLPRPNPDPDPGWTDTETAGSGPGEFIVDYTIPAGPTDFQIDAEVWVDGVWK